MRRQNFIGLILTMVKVLSVELMMPLQAGAESHEDAVSHETPATARAY